MNDGYGQKISKLAIRLALLMASALALQSCATTEELYAEYDENACKAVVVEGPSAAPERIVVREVKYRDSLIWQPAVYFDYKKDFLKSEESKRLLVNLAVLKKHSDLRVVIRGFTDEVGSKNYNRGLAERRVDFVVRYLRDRGIDSARMEKMPLGEELPFLMAENEIRSAINRRVELLLMDSSGRPVAYRVDYANTTEPEQQTETLPGDAVAESEQAE